MNENIFDKLDFGPLRPLLDNDDITDISFDNNGQIWVRSLTQGSLRVEVQGLTPEFVEKLAFQCSNVMGTTFNNAKPFLDAESSELRLNFVHPSIATNGIAMVIRKTPAKIRLEKEKLIKDDYFTQDIHDILIKCVEGHCNIIVCGETGSGKTEFVKYLASHTKTDEKIITIEDTLELHLDKIFPQRDIVAMKTNNVASYSDVLVTCMRQNPKWILLSEVRSAEAVSAVRNSISSGHNILSTIHADKASSIPYRLYSLMETDLDVNQFLNTIYRYIQLGVHIKAYYSKERGKFHREVDEVCEFYVDENNKPQSRIIYQKLFGQEPVLRKPSPHLIEYLENQNIDINSITEHLSDDLPFHDDLEREEYIESHKKEDKKEVVSDASKSVPNVSNITPVVDSIVQPHDNPTSQSISDAASVSHPVIAISNEQANSNPVPVEVSQVPVVNEQTATTTDNTVPVVNPAPVEIQVPVVNEQTAATTDNTVSVVSPIPVVNSEQSVNPVPIEVVPNINNQSVVIPNIVTGNNGSSNLNNEPGQQVNSNLTNSSVDFSSLSSLE